MASKEMSQISVAQKVWKNKAKKDGLGRTHWRCENDLIGTYWTAYRILMVKVFEEIGALHIKIEKVEL